MQHPETHPSLLVRIRDSADRDAWFEFAEVYRPVIVRVARARGMQDADADDLAQRVLVSVAGAIERFDPGGQAKFRTWLRRVIDNAIINAVRRPRPDRGSGGMETNVEARNLASSDGPDTDLVRIEYRRQVFAWAARRVRDEFSDSTWQSFWLTAVDEHSVDEAADQIGRTRGSVYASRSRVMRRLVEVIEQLEGDSHGA
ncbi:MAG: sigma-70 family RNA polymerase sigma factor [Rubripirellula sp.]